jgi:hypothetical protein
MGAERIPARGSQARCADFARNDDVRLFFLEPLRETIYFLWRVT